MMTKKALVTLSAVIILIAAACFFFLRKSNAVAGTTVPEVKKDTVAHIPQYKFGIAIDSFSVIEKTVEKDEVLSQILQLYNVDNLTIAKIADKSRGVFDVRNLATGHPYTILSTKDSLPVARFFIYQPNAIDYVVYDLRDSLNIYKGQREVHTVTKTAGGKIAGSLYETFARSGAEPALAIKLADLYAWTIDFYAIKEGDWFKVIYEQQYVKDEPVGLGTIKSAIFSHNGEELYAYFFQPDSTLPGEYYDENGKSLRRFFLKAPLKFSHITSRYTLNRFHPVQKRWKAHLGTDYAAPTGTPIIATGTGVVIESNFTRFNGNFVKIRHNNTYTTQYLHMSRRAVRSGQHISQGQVIGYVGSTGLATGPHVCYRFWKNGQQVDPLRQKFPSATPISNDRLPLFAQWKEKQQQLLSAITFHEQATAMK